MLPWTTMNKPINSYLNSCARPADYDPVTVTHYLDLIAKLDPPAAG